MGELLEDRVFSNLGSVHFFSKKNMFSGTLSLTQENHNFIV
jgi:hypothetical protein